MSAHDKQGTTSLSHVIPASVSPPPLAIGDCQKSLSNPLIPRCSELVPSPLASVPPPGASLGCYSGMVIDGRYRVGPVIGEGGMGIVYRARHVVIDKKVAIKILRADLARQKDITDRFLQEARAASSIGHPHIIDISDFGELPDGSTYLVMEYLEGESLADLLNNGPLPPIRLAKIAGQIADGLAAAHDRGIVHRDLKPENVFLVTRGSETDFAKVLDFGVAKVNASPETRITRVGVIFGTPHYMSPEQAAGTPVDSRADIYALGVMMYELASGRVPFESDELMGILTQHMYKKPVPLRALVDAPAVPPALEAIILKALSKEPALRYQTAQELSRDLGRFVNGDKPEAVAEMIARSASVFPASLFAEKTMPIAIPATPGPVRRTRWGMYAGFAGVLVTCSLALGVLMKGSPSTAATHDQVASGQTASNLAPISSAVGEAASSDAAGGVLPVRLTVQPADAHVFSDETDLGVTPLTFEVAKGRPITVEIRRKGYQFRRVNIDGTEGQLSVRLTPATAPAARPAKAPVRHKPKVWERDKGIVNPWAK